MGRSWGRGFAGGFFDGLRIELGGFDELLVDFLHEGGDADAALYAVVEFEKEMGAVFEDDAFGDAGRKQAALCIEFVDDGLLLGGGADDADEDVGVFEVGGEVYVGDGDQHVGKAMVTGEDAG